MPMAESIVPHLRTAKAPPCGAGVLPVEIEHVGTRDGYDRWAVIYDDEGNPRVALDSFVVPPLAGQVEGRRILDAGCGTGRHTAWLAEAGAHVTAMDFSTGMLERARERLRGHAVDFACHDLTLSWPFDDDSFDGVVSCLVLEHLADLGRFLDEAARVCRSGGFVLVSDMHPALRLRGNQAHFREAEGRREVRLESIHHRVTDYVKAALARGLVIESLEEHEPSSSLAASVPRLEKFLGWPMLFTMRLRVDKDP